MTRHVIPVENLTAVHPLPGLALRDPYLTMKGSGDNGKVLAWFNASSIVHAGKRWMVYRTECKRWFLWSRISIVQLDESMVPIEGTNRLLKLHTRFDGWGAEDPRMFTFNGGMYVSYGDGYRMLLAQLDDEGNIVRCGPIPADVPDLNPPQIHPREKNWGFFEYEGRLFCQYGACPTVTYEFDPQKWVVINKWESKWKWRSIYGDRLNGAAPPVLHGGLLWRWVHSHRVEKLPAPRPSWFSDKLQMTGHRYFSFLATFSPEPPFEPLMVSQKPVFFSPWDEPSADGPTHYSVVYVGSSEREREGWRLFYGENDCRIVSMHVTDAEATATMTPIERPKPKRFLPPARNFLHFIWMQGEDNMPEADAGRVLEWRKMNRDWDVRVWDDRSIATLIAEKAPQWLKVWNGLTTQRNERPTDMALTAKASDLARLIILSIRFSGEQVWNCYADTDTIPHRSLTEFFTDTEQMGGNFQKQPTFVGSPSEKDWDIDNYDLLVTEENLFTPHRGYLTNAVMLARPGALAITALLRAGALTGSRPTLKAWGPVMLRESVQALKRTPDGRRIDILPFHYLVWNQNQMSMPRPTWTVCSHLNAFRWNQPGVKTSNAGSARMRQLA